MIIAMTTMKIMATWLFIISNLKIANSDRKTSKLGYFSFGGLQNGNKGLFC